MNFTEQLEQAGDLLAKEDYRQAAKVYQEILKLDPNQAAALQGMGLIAHGIGNLEAAEDYLQRSLNQNPNQYLTWLKLGYICAQHRKQEKALQAFENAIKIEPNNSQGYFSLGSGLLQIGDKKNAIQNLEKAFFLDNDSPETLRILSTIAKLDENSPIVKEALKRVQNPDISENNLASLNYGLAYVYENIGNDKKFLHYLHQANALQKKQALPWRNAFERNFNVLQEIFTEKSFEITVDEKFKQYTPVFIVGLPRSGTTLTEQIITSHPDVYGADEVDYMTMFIVNGVAVMTQKPYLDGINELIRDQLEQLSLNYQTRMQKIGPGYACITDKYLSNFLSVGLIKKILPWAKVIALGRHPMDNALSIYRNYFLAQLPFCCDLEDTAHYYHIYYEMLKLWDQLLPGFVCHVEYENLVENFEVEARRIIDFCGLDWNDACLEPDKNNRPVMTLSQDQVRQPVYKTSVGKWKRFEKDLAPFRNVLENYGYTIKD